MIALIDDNQNAIDAPLFLQVLERTAVPIYDISSHSTAA